MGQERDNHGNSRGGPGLRRHAVDRRNECLKRSLDIGPCQCAHRKMKSYGNILQNSTMRRDALSTTTHSVINFNRYVLMVHPGPRCTTTRGSRTNRTPQTNAVYRRNGKEYRQYY